MSISNIHIQSPIFSHPYRTDFPDLNKKKFKISQTFSDIIRSHREQAISSASLNNPRVVIIGGGPGGLKRAIDSLLSGNPTTIIEKRSETNGRDNTVALNQPTIALLQELGAYQYLLDNSLIYKEKNDRLYVRLKDLELALKTIIANLCDEPVIFYDSQVEKIDAIGQLTIRNKENTTELTPELLIIADGARSPTAALLGNTRIPVLPKVPVIAAIFQDRNTPIRGPLDLVKAIVIRIADIAQQGYYTSLFLFKMLATGEHILNPNRHIIGTILLPTPGQNYLGIALNKRESDVISANKEKVMTCTQLLQEAELLGNPIAIEQAKKALQEAKKVYEAHIQYWSNLSFCFANMFALFQRIFASRSVQQSFSFWKPLNMQKTAVFDIGADKASHSTGILGKSVYLLAGDSLATVDPVTGLGCCTALTSSFASQAVLTGLNRGQDPHQLTQNYDQHMQQVIRTIHAESYEARLAYRADAVTV